MSEVVSLLVAQWWPWDSQIADKKSLLFTNVSKILPTAEERFIVILTTDSSPIFLNTGATDKTFPQSGKQDLFK